MRTLIHYLIKNDEKTLPKKASKYITINVFSEYEYLGLDRDEEEDVIF